MTHRSHSRGPESRHLGGKVQLVDADDMHAELREELRSLDK